jgi:hypothetical protein
MALAMCRPETMSSSGRRKRKRFELWLTISTSSSFRLTQPWSPPVSAALTSPGDSFSVAALETSLTFSSAFLAAGVPPRK